MKMSHIGTAALMIVVGFATFQNCAPPNAVVSNNSAPVEFKNLDKLENELQALAESDLSCSVNADCQLVDVGVQPCGGADYQIVASIKSRNYQSVLALAEEYSFQDKIQTRPDVVGVCAMKMPEIAKCQVGTCIKEYVTFE